MLECSNIILSNDDKVAKKNTVRLERGGKVSLYFKGTFDSTQLRYMLIELNTIIKIYKKGCKKIQFICSGMFEPKDKFIYNLLECILYTLKYQYSYEIEIIIKEANSTVLTAGLWNCLLQYFSPQCESPQDIIKKYKFIHTSNHFRRIVTSEKASDISVLLGELKSFFKFFHIDYSYGEQIARVISELVDNAGDHTNSDCLVDIDVSDPTYKEEGSDDLCYVINMVVLNFSAKLLNEDIMSKIKNRQYCNSERYNTVEEAYENHKKFFNKNYNENDFFTITSFQDRISGRKNESETGGTGLTELIKSLEDKAEAHSCYVLSGKQGLWLEPEFLEYNHENWIGFNSENNYLNSAPDNKMLLRSNVNFIGTGYNFTLVLKKEII